MKQYNLEELYRFFTNYLDRCDYNVSDIVNQGTDLTYDILGQGAFNTVFYFEQYPDIVFKINIGESDDIRDEYESCHRRYEAAASAHMDQYFAEVAFLGEYDMSDWTDPVTLTLYIQEKVEETAHDYYWDMFNFSLPEKCFSKEKKILKCSHENQRFHMTDILAYIFVRQYGIQEFSNLVTFLITNDINDIHCGNWGFDDEGHLKLIDYSF